MDGISQKRFLCLTPPSEADNRSAQARVLDALREEGLNARMPLRVLQALPALRLCGRPWQHDGRHAAGGLQFRHGAGAGERL